MPLISVRGNKFIDPQGNTVVFRGLAVSDPDKLEMHGHWNKEHFAKGQGDGGRCGSHPCSPDRRTPGEYRKLLDQAVEWSADLNVYIMLDWHSIGNLISGLFQDPTYETSAQEVYAFWRIASRRLRSTSSSMSRPPIVANSARRRGASGRESTKISLLSCEPKWEEDPGFAASQYPLVATESGSGGRPGAAAR